MVDSFVPIFFILISFQLSSIQYVFQAFLSISMDAMFPNMVSEQILYPSWRKFSAAFSWENSIFSFSFPVLLHIFPFSLHFPSFSPPFSLIPFRIHLLFRFGNFSNQSTPLFLFDLAHINYPQLLGFCDFRAPFFLMFSVSDSISHSIRDSCSKSFVSASLLNSDPVHNSNWFCFRLFSPISRFQILFCFPIRVSYDSVSLSDSWFGHNHKFELLLQPEGFEESSILLGVWCTDRRLVLCYFLLQIRLCCAGAAHVEDPSCVGFHLHQVFRLLFTILVVC